MKLLLTSAGLSRNKIKELLLEKLPKKPEDCSVLVFALIENKHEEGYKEYILNNLRKTGFKDITFYNLKDEKFKKQKGKKYDLLFASGGGTYFMLNKIRKNGFDKTIKKIVKDGALYFGVSAGSILAGPEIDIAGWGSESDDIDKTLKSTKGLGFTKIAVYPHFRKSLQKEVDEFRKKVKYPVIELTDGQAVFVDDKGYKIIE